MWTTPIRRASSGIRNADSVRVAQGTICRVWLLRHPDNEPRLARGGWRPGDVLRGGSSCKTAAVETAVNWKSTHRSR